jgi:hypothetical protein
VDELLADTITTEQPQQIRKRLRGEVVTLLNDGMDPRLIGESLRRWNTRPGAQPGLLPFLYSEVLKEQTAGQRNGAYQAALDRVAACPDCDESGQIDLGDAVRKCEHPKLGEAPR